MAYETSALCNLCDGYTYDDDGTCLGCGAAPQSRSIYAAIERLKASKGLLTVLFLLIWFSTRIEFGGQEKAPGNITSDKTQPQRAVQPRDATAARRITPSQLNPPQPIQISDDQPAPFSLTKTTWGAHFNPDSTVPADGFYAYYFDSSSMPAPVQPEKVQNISIEVEKQFRGISPGNFAAYFIGVINTPEKVDIEIMTNKGWNEFRVIVDGSVVQDYSRSGALSLVKTPQKKQMRDKNSPREKVALQQHSATQIPKSPKGNAVVSLLPGDHLIEVEFLNHWHTTDFSVDFRTIQ